MKIHIFLIIFTLFTIINTSTDCSSCTINNKKCVCSEGLEDCRWLKIESNLEKCMNCSEISKGESDYYSRKFTINNEPFCHKVGKSGYTGAKLIDETKQIVNDCKELGLYKLGDICYDSCPENSISGSNNECNCQYLYYKEIKEGLTYINCLGDEVLCPNEYKYINEKECVKACPDEKPYLDKVNSDNNQYFCKEVCNKYFSIKSPLGKINTYCFNPCPDYAKFYYEDDNVCIEKCSRNEKDFYNINNKCIDNLDIKETDCGSNYYINVYPEDYIFQCIEITTDNQPCPNEFPNKFSKNSKTYCLKSCEDTNIKFFDNIITYLYSENEHNECIDILNTELFMIEKEKRLVSDCSTEVFWPYHIEKKCVSNCGNKYIDNDSNECLDNCKNNYYLDEETKTCFENCPDYLGRGFYNEEGKCVSCGVDGEGSGFHKENDFECYNKCPSGYKHNYLNNICLLGECKNHDYKFFYKLNPNVCYYSCNEVGNDFKIEKEYECYKEGEEDDSFKDYYFYRTSYGSKRYIKKTEAVKECFKNGLKYIRNNECVENCRDEEFKVYPTKDKLGKCYNSKNDCLENNYIFYYNSKICSETCDYYTINDNTANLEGRENCFIKCPSDYPFLDGKICKEKCDECYIEEDEIKKCSSKEGYFIQKDGENNKCVKYCTNSQYPEDENGIPNFSYYNSENICLDSCINQENKFSYEAINKHQECLPSCSPNEYYYENQKLCQKKCDKYYKNENSKICVDKCEDGEYIHPGNICSKEKCPPNAPFYEEEEEDSITIKKCVFSCKHSYIFETKKCVENDSSLTKKLYGGLIEDCPKGYLDNGNICSKPESCTNYFSLDNEDTNEGSGYKCIEQIENCSWYITTIGECVQNCPIGERFINNNNLCKSNCLKEGDIEGYYKKFNVDGEYIIYECVDSCSDPTSKHINEERECIEECGDLYESENVCYSDCKSLNSGKFTLYEGNNLNCDDSCGELYYNNENKICNNDCLFLSTKIINDKDTICINKCDSSSDYKFLQIIDYKFHCSTSCIENSENKRYISTDYKCIPKCPLTHYVVETTGECISLSSCDKKISLKNNEYICSDSCLEGFPYTYKDSNLCISNCEEEDYIINENTCIKDCSSLNTADKNYYFYEYDENLGESTIKENTCVEDCSTTKKPFLRKNGHCDIECDSSPLGDYYYIENTNVCIEKSECNGKKIEGRVCKTSCEINKYEDETNFCLSNCYYSTNKKLYYKINQFSCQEDFYQFILDKNILKSNCDLETNFYNEQQCVIECPKGKKYIIDDNTCKNDCSETVQYFTEITQFSKTIFKCQSNCNAYVIFDKNINAKLCLGDNCNSIYPYYINLDQKECYEKCPDEYQYYYIPDTSTVEIKCINEGSIPNDYLLLQNTNKYIKKSECYPNYIDMDINQCVIKCSEGQVIYNNNAEGQTPFKYCSRNCTIFNENLHLDLNGQECIKGEDCSDNEIMITLANNIKKCDCKNLYYNDITNGEKVCIDENEINCTKQIEYPYLIKGTKQCSHICEGILSLNGSDCYIDENYKCPENSKQSLSNNLNKCVCDDKYYHFETENSKEIYCLPKDSKCPRNETFNRELLIKETNECVEYCPFDNQIKKYGKTCVKLCPIMSVVVNDECFCQDKWYMNEKDEMICTDVCPDDKKIMIDETKECVETCINTKYPVYYKNKCYLDCSKFPETNKIDNIQDIENSENSDYKGYNLYNIYGKYGESICYCKGPWYEEGPDNGCNDNINNLCNVFEEIYAYKYTVLPTKQCVSKCPEYFPYSFNDNCFESCEKGNELLEFNLNINKKIKQDGDSKICICNNLWKYDNDDISKIECLNEENCENGYLLIDETKECYNGAQCREEYPLLFNNKCYNKDNCPENTIYKEDSPKTCSCVNYYYLDSQNNIICLPKNENCPENYPNLIYSKNKCVDDESNELNDYYYFNGIYYNNCPLYSKYDEGKDKCICDILYGYWYNEDNKLYCGLKVCPNNKVHYISKTRECLSKCSTNEYKYVEYNGICYDKCPDLTKENKDGLCELELENKSENITQFTQIIKNNIVSLYKAAKSEESENEGSESNVIDLVNSNSTVEFYGVNNNKKENKMKHNKNNKTSSLSYIDLSECIQKIYENNNMDPEDDIIILKFDMKNTPKEYLINPVEYKFLNSRNGQELDASVCAHGSIKISYPFTNIISNYDKITKKKRILKAISIDIKNENDLETLTEKYNIGKEINKEYSFVDSFNSKDKIYTDFCTSIVINGKDLVLEDRMNYLLPHYSLCEQNCTYNHTDFEEERIYCGCSFKSEFDLNRDHETSIDINENAVIQSQDGKTNFPVLKCFNVLGDSKRIKKNIAFYYMLIIIIIEICLLIMTISFGIKSFKFYFSNKINDNNNDNNDNNENDIEIEINAKDKDKNKYEEIIKTTQRSLNAPPKKSNNEKEELNDENNNEKNGIEFIPDEFLFLYFNEEDKGVRKEVIRNELPFNINENTKVLLQKIENVDYTNIKASGPFPDDQNLIEIIDEKKEDNVKFNIESINDTLFENDDINEKNKIKNKLNEKEIIPINEEKIYKRENLKNYIINDLDELEEDKENKKTKSFLDDIKLEQRLLTKDFNFVIDKNENGIFTFILAEIFDKIYIIKNILFLRKYEIMFLNLSVYVLYHVILLGILAMFYDIKTIKNIWNKENYPGMGLYLGYGLASILISWILYIIFLCLLSNKGKYNEILIIRKSKKKNKENKAQLINKKCNLLISKMKTKMIIYFIIQFILIIFFFIYLVTLCAVYSATSNKIFSSYGIAILEIILLKIIYGLILGILRYSSLSSQNKGLYNFVLFFDKYLV